MSHQLSGLKEKQKRFKESSDQKNSQKNKIEEERDFFLKIFDSFKDGVYIVDENENIQYVNPFLEEEFGNWEGKKCYKYFHGRNEVCSFCKNKRVFAGETVQWEWYSDKNGKTYDLLGTLIINSDGTKSKLEVFRDISDRKLNETLKMQRVEAIALLAGGIAHDFNNFLTAVIGNINLIQLRNNLDASLVDNLNEIEIATSRAKELTNQLLTFSKGGTPIKNMQKIVPIIKNCLSLAMAGSNSKSKIHFEENLPLVDIDGGQITQVFNNLTINSLHAMPDGGLIDIYLEMVKITEEMKLPLKMQDYLKISYSDTGVGIAKKNKHLVFQPYFTTKIKGIGLGLATCYSIIKKHGGYLTYESELSKGTTFNIYLPISNM